jgi:hypothetical protein
LAGFTVHISGSLEQIREKLLLVKQVIAECEAVGFDSFDMEFVYRYVTMLDNRVCADCLPYHGVTFQGGYVQSEFPRCRQAWGNTIDPCKHDGDRCYLRLINGPEACATLLSKALQVVT